MVSGCRSAHKWARATGLFIALAGAWLTIGCSDRVGQANTEQPGVPVRGGTLATTSAYIASSLQLRSRARATAPATYSRLTRGAKLEALEQDYIRTARAKGVPERHVLFRHALRGSLAPVVSQVGIDLGAVMGGAIVTEVVFGLPGLGREAVLAITTQDLPVIMGITILSAVLVVGANVLVDLVHAVIDPRIRLE